MHMAPHGPPISHGKYTVYLEIFARRNFRANCSYIEGFPSSYNLYAHYLTHNMQTSARLIAYILLLIMHETI